jgi:hypothetical protein
MVVGVGMVGQVGVEEDVTGIVIVGFMSMTRRWAAMSICMGIRILFVAIVLIVDVGIVRAHGVMNLFCF